MEEISSLDSFGPDSNARPETETPRPEEQSPRGEAPGEEEQAPIVAEQDTPASPPAEDAAGSVGHVAVEVPNPNEDSEEGGAAVAATVGSVEKDAAEPEEDFDQISEGSLDAFDNHSQEKADKPATPRQQDTAAEGSVEADADAETPLSSEPAADDADPAEAEAQPEAEAGDEEEQDDREEASMAEATDEADALKLTDAASVQEADADAVDGAPASNEAMDVDEGEAATAGDSPHTTEAPDDVEMRSPGEDSHPPDDAEPPEGRDEVDNSLEEQEAEGEVPAEDEDNADADADAEPEEAADDAGEAEHGDDTVENVLEPEESDVCLIPDDNETEVTEAEKEWARENAEKAAEEEIAAEQASSSKTPENDGTTANADPADPEDGDAASSAEPTEDATAVPPNDAQADAPAGTQPTASEGAEDDVNDSLANDEEAAADAPDADEPTAEEAASATAGEAGAPPKIIISWVVGSVKTCRQCGIEKTCGFRFKRPEEPKDKDMDEGQEAPEEPVAPVNEYLCDQACCNALLEEQPGKYFVRRKKFLVEEVAGTAADTSEEAEAEECEAPPEGDESRTEQQKRDCLQCKQQTKCQYLIRQDQDTYYICNDDCFNLLNAEEPDKYKLKRHSIRVRNIGATAMQPSAKRPETSVVARTNVEAEAARLDRIESFRRRCADCATDIDLNERQLMWETMDFCNEVCLRNYQLSIGSKCETCKQDVSSIALGKYCVRFGFEVRQFCCAACLNTFKKGLKTCSCCQKDISSGQEGFLAPVGDKDQFKDFCSQVCLRRYDCMCNPKKKLRMDMCGVCNNEKPVRVEMLLDDKEHYFCSNPCFSAFKFVSNVNADPCAMCSKYFERKSAEAYTIYNEQQTPKVFCSRICINVYIIVNRHIVSCQWCKVKKYNFDMIYQLASDQETLTCSINCLTMHGVSCNISARAVTKCDNCSQFNTPQYHLTMSDASMRNFCTYQCVMQFQNQFSRTPLTLDSDTQPSSSSKSQQSSPSSSASSALLRGGNKNSTAPFPTGLPKRVKLKLSNAKNNSMPANKKSIGGTVVPVIANVTSLATENDARGAMRRKRGRKMDSPPPLTMISGGTQGSSQIGVMGRGRPRKHVDYGTRSPSPGLASTSTGGLIAGRRNTATGSSLDFSAPITETKIITVPPYPKAVRNVNISCKPMMVSTGEQCKPLVRDCATQTDKDYSNKVLIPVPVPIFVPQPMYMYSAPFPVPVPIPLPIPVPIFIPTTRNTAQGILKEIKKIQDKMPEDPLEAELLMMAEMVAEEKHDSDSDSDNEIKPDPGLVNLQYQNSLESVNQQQQQQVVDVSGASHNPYGDDMLQIALKMATADYDNHHQSSTVDLESSMTANTIPTPPMGHDAMGQMGVHHLDQQHHMLDASSRSPRGRKRGGGSVMDSPNRNSRSPVKRPRGNEMDHSALQLQSQQAQQPQEKPDAQMFLKYTFGVNAWKQWVMTKNADIEKSSMRRRPFKTELLQMTADELNYSLCLFVKEVRKPNGTEYAPDTIYYLVLGIQQYLYVNGRIDNIFYDAYYERFTECLDEVARKFSVLYNDSQYIVTRVEEEHLWECKQLGAHSPHVLLSTLMFFNTKHFNLTTVEEHMQLSFSHIMKHWKRSSQNSKVPGSRNVLLRFYPPQAGLDANPRKKKVYEQQENEENPLRCPVRLYEFYLSKCPESVKTRNDVFYLQPERSCVPDSPVWYSTQALGQDALQRMLHRVKMVKEINIALLTT
ncbi:zinc finger MYM-type protein 4 isoform X1 [Drosophila pseudoobscura]|uniref:Zinc finger MYM-type protein 4 isoform X1 n=1 Tax=Drosophila pseudoobscura pseudoobscura TaxID=46245 RepID=A0A6I8VAD7_DROPS|nr:zinc finger MYM-type protein 4 isoform X1 [Drosophila pseudoobscura]XP_015037107.2 zinc finger MYM-type protein 4 isoform X1 [Drosophila pseudoobscura]XP_033233050.1 zinc finger MYM-type protein 4 isoform X1 [Drosophila pseudoobscura]